MGKAIEVDLICLYCGQRCGDLEHHGDRARDDGQRPGVYAESLTYARAPSSVARGPIAVSRSPRTAAAPAAARAELHHTRMAVW